MFPVCTLGPEAGRKRWQGQDAGGTPALPGDANHSPLEGESQKPSRQAKADAVGGGRRAARLRPSARPTPSGQEPVQPV